MDCDLNQKVCFPFSADFAPDELEVNVREHILQDLETFVRRHFAGDVIPPCSLCSISVFCFSNSPGTFLIH